VAHDDLEALSLEDTQAIAEGRRQGDPHLTRDRQKVEVRTRMGDEHHVLKRRCALAENVQVPLVAEHPVPAFARYFGHNTQPFKIGEGRVDGRCR